MTRNMLVASAAPALLWLGASAAEAQPTTPSADDLNAIRAEIEALKADYGAKIKALESKLDAATHATEGQSASTPGPIIDTGPIVDPGPVAAVDSGPKPPGAPAAAAPITSTESAPQAAPARAPISQNAYNPGIAVTLQGQFKASTRDPDTARIPGFPVDDVGGPPRGFSIDESEIALFANVDHKLSANLIVSFNDGDVNVEEGYIQTTSLPGGFTLKAGRMFSGIAYLNERHSHDWDFIDAPLPYRALLGEQYGDDGVQLRWIAPTPFFLEAGGEWFRGANYPAGGSAAKGKGTAAAWVQTGGDLGASSSWLAKASWLRAKAAPREIGTESFDGTENIGVASLVYKWAPGGNPTSRNFIANGEFFYARLRGDYDATPIAINRTGWYAQAIYQFQPLWRVGMRYARLGSEAVPAALAGTGIDDLGRSPDAATVLLEHDTSEFSRIRLMYTYNSADVRSGSEFLLRYTIIIGPHGAHRF